MAVSLFCKACKKSSKLGAVKCQCGHSFKSRRQYRVRVRLPSGKWKSRVVDSLDLAKKVEGQFNVDKIKEKDFGIHAAPRIDKAWKKYIAWAKVNKRSWRDDETRWNKHIAGHVGNKTMDKIRPRDVDAIVGAMRNGENTKGKPYAPATIKQVLVLIKRVYNWSIKAELYRGSNPANKIDVPRFDNQVTNPLTRDDLTRLLMYLNRWENERAALLIKFALFSGRRRGEILHLRWENVDLENGYVTFPGMITKNKKTQTVPMNQSCMAILNRCRELQLSHWVFPSSTGAFYTTFENTWKRLKSSLILDYRFHDLRHSFASYLASSGQVDILTLKELLGHKDLKMTQRYAHLINGALKRGANVADDMFNQNSSKTV